MPHKPITKITIGLNALYVLVVALFFMDAYSRLEIAWQPLKTAVYYSLMAGSILVIIWNGVTIYKRFYYILLPSIMLTYCLITGPMHIFMQSGVWHTRQIVYKNRYNGAVIAYQMKDIGALGYKKRTVQLCSFTPFFSIVTRPPLKYTHTATWQPVFKEVNEMGIKYP